MDARRVTVQYDETAEYLLTRVTLMRFGVPTRVLDKEMPVGSEG